MGYAMPTLRSGLVLAAGYADKLRKTVFAQLKDYVKRDKEFANKIAYYIATLNRALFTLLVEELKVDKLDVVRITIEYDVDEVSKALTWKWDTLRVEIYKRIPPETFEETLKNFILRAPELAVGVVKFAIGKLGETLDGDLVYVIKVGEREVGAAIALQVDENIIVLKKAAVVEPIPAIFDKAKLELAGRSVEDALTEQLSKVVQVARHVSREDALEITNFIRSRVEAKPMETPPELEVEGEE